MPRGGCSTFCLLLHYCKNHRRLLHKEKHGQYICCRAIRFGFVRSFFLCRVYACACVRDVLTCTSPLPFAARLRCSLSFACLRLTFFDPSTRVVLREARGRHVLQVRSLQRRSKTTPHKLKLKLQPMYIFHSCIFLLFIALVTRYNSSLGSP